MTGDEVASLLKDLQAEKGLEDLLYFNKEILEHDRMTEEMHGELCRNASLPAWFLGLMPRGTYKTAAITEGLTIQQIIKNRNLRVCIFCETYGKAVWYVNAIREHLESEKLTSIYGEMRDDKMWREEGIRIKGRTKLQKEPSVCPSGVDKSVTGFHFDLIICDDLLGDTNTNTPEQLLKTKKRFEEMQSLLEPDGKIIMIGTIWDEDDLYCDIITKQESIEDWMKLLEKKFHKGRDWNIYIRQAIEGGVYAFPSILNEATLEKLKRSQTNHRYMMQYFNNPLQVGHKAFEDEWRDNAKKNYEAYTVDQNTKEVKTNPWGSFRKYLVVDPAISKNPKADYTGMITIAVDSSDMRYVYGVHQERFDTTQLINAIFDAADAGHVNEVILEASGFQKIIVEMITREKIKRGKYWKLTSYNPGTTKSKEQRIETLVGRFRTGKIGYSPDFTELDRQIRKFPNLSARDHDDLIDALSISEIAIAAKQVMDMRFTDPEDMLDYSKVVHNPVMGI